MNISASIKDEECFQDIKAILNQSGTSLSQTVERGLKKDVIFQTRFGRVIEAMRSEYDIPLDFQNEEQVEIPVRTIPKSLKEHIDRHLWECGYGWDQFVALAFVKFAESKDGNPGLIRKIRDNFKPVIN